MPVRGAGRGAEDQNRAAYEKSLTTLPDWRIACNFVGRAPAPGVATAALAGLDLIASRRRQVEGYPGRGFGSCRLPLQRALSTYEQLGFVRERKIGKHRWVVTKVVEPTS